MSFSEGPFADFNVESLLGLTQDRIDGIQAGEVQEMENPRFDWWFWPLCDEEQVNPNTADDR